MAGIYIHIPFCKQACHYCNFHFSTSLKLQNDFSDALLKEIALRQDYIGEERVDTIYFGGGTPSLLEADQLDAFLDTIRNTFRVDPAAEITLEANPDDIDYEKLKVWQQRGINRLSIGVQSFFGDDLRWMNRAHTTGQALDSIRLAQDMGITNLSIDLIYGSPDLTDDKWMSNMEQAAALGVPHLSCYALTVEPGTALDLMTRKKKALPVDPETQARQFLMMTDFFQEEGYEHYEISNLAVPGQRSRHNSAYWNGARYLGLGPSAHSFNGHSRQWTVANNALYIQSLKNGLVDFEKEELTETQQLNEYVMTALRKIEGVDISRLRKEFGDSRAEIVMKTAEKFVDRGWLESFPDRLALTREGKLFADGIASELFA